MEFVTAMGGEVTELPPVLVMPALSIGNVGQLGSELLIHSLSAVKAGYLEDPYVLPCIGNDPFGPQAEGNLTTALEVFKVSADGVAIVQQRTPVQKGMMMSFARNFASWAKRSGVEEIIILSGLDTGRRNRQGMAEPQIQYISSANPDGSDEHCEQIGWKLLQEYSPSNQAWRLLEVQASEKDVTSISQVALTDETFFAGLPFSLLFACCKDQGLKVVCILCCCSEGDNIPDAFLVAEGLMNFLHPKEGKSINWRIPLSWTTVYGPPPDDSIF